MSGGSFNYLCGKSATELSTGDLREMADALEEAGAADAAALSRSILSDFAAIDAKIERLNDVWHDMEWWCSGDYTKDQFDEALAKFRAAETARAAKP
jgi:hypothetical protein